jgi:pantothenate kinase type III
MILTVGNSSLHSAYCIVQFLFFFGINTEGKEKKKELELQCHRLTESTNLLIIDLCRSLRRFRPNVASAL